MTEGTCGKCLWYHEEHNPAMTKWYGFCTKHDKRTEDHTTACADSFRAWHIPEHVELFIKESMPFMKSKEGNE